MSKRRGKTRFFWDGGEVARPIIAYADGKICKKNIPIGAAMVNGHAAEIAVIVGANEIRVEMTSCDSIKFRVTNHFSCKLGSSIWPSYDFHESPFDIFICKYCGDSFQVRMCGYFSAEDSLEQRLMATATEHLLRCPADPIAKCGGNS